MKTTKILALAFLLIGNLSCQKETIDLDQSIDSELKVVNGKGDIWGNNCGRPIDCLSIEEHPPITDLRKNYPYLTTTVFKGAIWRLGTNPTTGTYTISKSKNGTDWETVTTIPNNRVTFLHLVVFKNELWLAGYVAPFGISGPNLLKSSDGHHWESVDSNPISSVRSLFVFRDQLYMLGDLKMYYTVYGHGWSRFDFPPFLNRRVISNPEIVVFKNHVYAFTNSAPTQDPVEIWKSADGRNWHKIIPRFPSMWWSRAFSITSYKGKLWRIGGYALNSNRWVRYNDIWYSDDAVNWKKFTGQNPIKPVSGHSATVFKDKLWLFGGRGTLNRKVMPIYEITF